MSSAIGTMRAVKVERYGPAEDVLVLSGDTPVPQPADDEILVKVHATAINPVDCVARNGYGRNIFSTLWGELPLILGRDISGVVTDIGRNVSQFSPGDEVYAAPHIGCYAEYATVKAEHAALKPRNISHREAAALPFVALTTWTALVDKAGLNAGNCAGRKIVIARAAGGVGSFAVQLMKAWGAHVAGICSTRNVELVKSLGADEVVDYGKQEFTEVLGGFDAAFDTIGKPGDFEAMNGKGHIKEVEDDFDEKLLSVLKQNADAAYVTICSPKMVLTDRYGLEQGIRIAEKLFQQRAEPQRQLGRRYFWSFFNPNGQALAEIAGLIEANRIRPVIDRVYALEDMVAAHNYCETGLAQGKIVIDISGD